MDDAGILQHGNEVGGSYDALGRVHPARQDLKVAYLAGRNAHDGLAPRMEPALLEGLVDMAKHVATEHDLVSEFVIVSTHEGVAPTAQLVAGYLGAVAREPGDLVFLGELVVSRTEPDGRVLVLCAEVVAHLSDTLHHVGRVREDQVLVGRKACDEAAGKRANDRCR